MMHYRMIPVARIALAGFVSENLDALRNAAVLLGGAKAARRVTELARGLVDPLPLSARLGRELNWLEGLLTLEHVDDPNREEAAHFGAIDPMDPVVAEICLLTDELGDRLASLREEEPLAFRSLHQAA